MKKLFVLFLLVGLFVSGLFGKEVGKFDILVTSKDKIEVNNSLMTYYFMRFHSADGKKVSTPVLIYPSSSKLTSTANITVKGFIPQFDGKLIAINSKKTEIDTTLFPDWKNSVITLQGANLLDVKNSHNFSFSSQATLFGLNLLQVSSFTLDAMTAGQASGVIDSTKALKLSKFFTNAKDYVDNLSLLLAITENEIEILNILVNDKDCPAEVKKQILGFKNSYGMVKEIVDKSSGVLGSIKANTTLKKETRTNLVYLLQKRKYKKFLKKDITDKMMNSYLSDISKDLSSATSESKKFAVIQQVLADLHNGLKLYEDGLDKDKSKKFKQNIRVAKIVILGLGITTKVISDTIKEDDMTYATFELFKDLGGAVIGELLGELPQIIADKSKSLTLKATKKIFGAISVGSTVGNKIIPFMWDFTLSSNYISAGIVDKQISLYPLHSKVKLSNEEGKTIWDSSANTTSQNIVYLSPNEKIKVDVFAQQDYLWDSERSPWNLKQIIVKGYLYSAGIFYNTGENNIALQHCVNKSIDAKLFYTPSFITFISQDLYKGAEASKTHQCDKKSNYTHRLDALAERHKLKTMKESILSSTLTIGELSKSLLVLVDAYDNASSHYTIKFQTLNVPMTSTTSDGKDYYEVGTLSLAPKDSVVKYVWNINNSATFTETKGGKVFNENAPTGNYPVKVSIYTASGNVITHEMMVNKVDLPPVITLNGSASVSIALNGTYTELGASAVDDIDGIYVNIYTVGTVNTKVAGVYTITYTAIDSSDNQSKVTRTVTVGNSGVSTLKKTGQTKSYDENGNEVTNGSIKDDGYYQSGVTHSYTRDNAKEIVTDNLTKLQWQDDSEARTLSLSWQGAKDYCDGITLGGYSDWRLPEVEALEGIVDYGRSYPSINPAFVNVSNNYYWSSTSASGYTVYAWIVYLRNGYVDNYTKYYSFCLRCVRAGQ